MSPTIECTIPVLPISNLKRSITFCTEQMGFTLDWKTAGFCSLSRDKHPIMLRQTEQHAGGAWVWIGVESTAIFEQLKSSGVTVLQQPRNYSWAYEMKFADPDGNVLWLGTESRSDIPFQD